MPVRPVDTGLQISDVGTNLEDVNVAVEDFTYCLVGLDLETGNVVATAVRSTDVAA